MRPDYQRFLWEFRSIKCFAKLGSDMKKPDATTVIPIDRWQNIVWPQPLGNPVVRRPRRHPDPEKIRLETIGQLAAYDPAMPEQLLGKMGRQLWEYANGLDKSPVKPRHAADPVKSVGSAPFDDLVLLGTNLRRLDASMRQCGRPPDAATACLPAASARLKTYRSKHSAARPAGRAYPSGRDIYRATMDLAR